MNRSIVYRLMTAADMAAAEADGQVPRREIDTRDGYFHLSAETQLIETANLHFDGEKTLHALGFEAASLGGALKWELAPKRGEEFPHLHDERLPLAMAVSRLTLKRREGGSFAVSGKEEL